MLSRPDGLQRQRPGRRRRGPRPRLRQLPDRGAPARDRAPTSTPACRPTRWPPRRSAGRRGCASLELGLEDHRIVGLCDGELQLRLHQLHQLAHADDAAAARSQPAGTSSSGCSARDAEAGPGRGRAEGPLPAEHPRRGRRGNPRPEIGPRPRGPAQARRVPDLDPRGRARHSTGPTRRARRNDRPAEPPSGIPADPTEHARLMFELLALAFQADLTRVATMMVGRESSIRSYDHLGLPESHHQLSHHKNDPATLAKLVEDPDLSHGAVRQVRRQAQVHAGRRRDPARPLHDPLRGRHRRQQPPHAREVARSRRRQGQRQPEERPAHRLREGHSRHEPSSGHAGPRRACGRGAWATAPGCWRFEADGGSLQEHVHVVAGGGVRPGVEVHRNRATAGGPLLREKAGLPPQPDRGRVRRTAPARLRAAPGKME